MSLTTPAICLRDLGLSLIMVRSLLSEMMDGQLDSEFVVI
jgi:hypothetical protein